MSAVTLTPVDNTTAPVVVNSQVIYHVFTINGVTRVIYSKDGRDVYQVDVQESAASIAAASPNLIEVTTVNGAEYLFVASTSGIMFIETDGSGSKILFKYHEEATPINIYSSDSTSVIAARINAAGSTTVASYEAIAQTTSFNTSVTMSTDKAIITTMPWSNAGPVQDGFTVSSPLISSSSILHVYISDQSQATPVFINVVKGVASCDIWFDAHDQVAPWINTSFNLVVEIIN